MSPKARTHTVSAVLAIIAVVILSLAATSIASSGQGGDDTTTVKAAASTTTSTTDPGPSAAEVSRWNRTVERNNRNTWIWITTKTNEATWITKTNERIAAAKAEAARRNAADAAAERRSTPPDSQRGAPAPAPSAGPATGRCGGDLPPCYVMMRESGGSLTAQNPSSTASGKWQFLDSTWAGFGGYARAMYAPESVQDAKARILWDGGRGCSHWSAC